MLDPEDLKKIVILTYLSEEMLEKIMPIVDFLRFDERESVFREGDSAVRFYMLSRGKVLLEKRISENITVSVGTVKSGFSFGWSSMLEGDAYTTDAICAEPCQVFSFRREKILPLMESDPKMGYIISQRLLRVVKKRLDLRTEQFLRALSSHPDLSSFF